MMGRKSLVCYLGLLLIALSVNASAFVTDPNIITAASRVTGVNPAPVLVNGGLVPGALQFIDRPAIFFGDVGVFYGLDYVQTAMNDRNTTGENTWYQVTVDKPGTLFLFIDNRIGDGVATNPPTLTSKMAWVEPNGFTMVSDSGYYTIPGYSEPASIYAKAVTAGTYILYEQNDGTSRAMYGIAAAPAGWNFPPVIKGIPSTTQVPPGGSLVIDSAVITDDGIPDPPAATTVEWTVESKPDGTTVTFTPDAFTANVTVDFSDLGNYTLKIAASDSNQVAEQLVQVAVQIPTFAIDTDDFAEICNDTATGPDSTSGDSSTYARNYTNQEGTATRRRLFYYNWDISSLKSTGEVFFNSYLTMNANSVESNARLYIYGVKEEYDNFTVNGYATWNNMPGVIPNLPLSTLIDESVLDREDIVPLMEVVYLDHGSTKEWVSFPASAALSEFMNADTNDSVMLMFAVLEEGDTVQLYSPGYKSAPTYTETGENLQGVIIQTNRAPATWATNPTPQINSTQSTALAELSWTNPSAVGNLTTEVWIGTGEPNDVVGSGDGFTLLPDSDTSDAAVSLFGYTLEVGTTYNWVVNCTDDGTGVTTQGFTWSFYVGNGYPVITLDNLYLWLGNDGDPGSATAVIDATVTDEGLVLPEPILLWEQLDGPVTVAIDPNNVEDLTLTLPAKGTYTFKLTADDGELVSAATTTVFVGDTPCDAAKAKPDYVQIPADFNNDCYVDLTDFSTFALRWLECNVAMDAPCVP